MKAVIIFTILIIVGCLVQVSFLPLPFGLVLLLVWFMIAGTRGIVWLVLIFSLSLASLANLPTSFVLLSTTVSVFLFIIGRAFLPANLAITFWLGLICLAVWELATSLLLGLAS